MTTQARVRHSFPVQAGREERSRPLNHSNDYDLVDGTSTTCTSKNKHDFIILHFFQPGQWLMEYLHIKITIKYLKVIDLPFFFSSFLPSFLPSSFRCPSATCHAYEKKESIFFLVFLNQRWRTKSK